MIKIIEKDRIVLLSCINCSSKTFMYKSEWDLGKQVNLNCCSNKRFKVVAQSIIIENGN